MPLRDFLHRFTRSIFWEIEDMIPFSNHPLYRCLWGWLGPPEVSLLKLFQGPVIRRSIPRLAISRPRLASAPGVLAAS